MSTYQYAKTGLTEGLNPVAIKSIGNSDSPYSVLSGDDQILVSTASGAVTVTLPKISDLALANRTFKSFYIKKSETSAAAVTINPATGSGDTIDGLTTFSLPVSYVKHVQIQCDPVENNWVVIDTDVAPS